MSLDEYRKMWGKADVITTKDTDDMPIVNTVSEKVFTPKAEESLANILSMVKAGYLDDEPNPKDCLEPLGKAVWDEPNKKKSNIHGFRVLRDVKVWKEVRHNWYKERGKELKPKKFSKQRVIIIEGKMEYYYSWDKRGWYRCYSMLKNME